MRAFRYAVAKAEKAEGVCEMSRMRVKLGKRRAVVVPGVGVAGSEDAVMRTFVKG